MTSLTARQRSKVILEHIEGTPTVEIARRAHLSVDGVEQILHFHSANASNKPRPSGPSPRPQPEPRRLVYWLEGRIILSELPNILHLMRHVTAQTICLTITDSPKSVWEIASETGIRPDFVEEIMQGLLEAGAAVSVDGGKYLLNFIALKTEAWHRLIDFIRQPAQDAAVLLAKSETRLKAAFEETPLARSGWSFREVIWPLYAGIVATLGIQRNLPPGSRRCDPPIQPNGLRHIMGAYEIRLGEAPLWSVGCHADWSDEELNLGCFWAPFKSEDKYRFSRAFVRVLEAFAKEPRTKTEALAGLEMDASEAERHVLELLDKGFLRANNGFFRPAIPIITHADNDILLAPVNRSLRPIIEHVLSPTFTRIEKMLSEWGYERLQTQYNRWHRWIGSRIMGEAMRHLMHHGMLPHVEEPYPTSFAFLAWEPQLPLMTWEDF